MFSYSYVPNPKDLSLEVRHLLTRFQLMMMMKFIDYIVYIYSCFIMTDKELKCC